MESGPPKIAQVIIHWLVPPACREEILGDMRERNQTSFQYFVEASCTVPSVIYSRIRRTADMVLTFFMAVSMYTAFVVSAWWVDPALLFRENGFARLVIPPAIILTAIIFADVYSNPKKRWPLKPLLGPIIGLALASAIQLNHLWAVSASVLAWGGALSVLLASTLRLTFPPVTERPQTAKIPAFWQKLEILPPSFNLKSALFPYAVALAVVLYMLIRLLIRHS